jgi:hypothetical protein
MLVVVVGRGLILSGSGRRLSYDYNRSGRLLTVVAGGYYSGGE